MSGDCSCPHLARPVCFENLTAVALTEAYQKRFVDGLRRKSSKAEEVEEWRFSAAWKAEVLEEWCFSPGSLREKVIERLYRRELVVPYIEDRIELGHVQHVLHFLA